MAVADFISEIRLALTEGRELAEARMDSTCRIFYRTGQSTITNGIEAFVYANRATNVPCRIHPPSGGAQAQDTTPAAVAGVRMSRTWSIPVDSAEVFPGDLVELTTVGPLTDPTLAGKTFRVVDVAYASQATARRLQVEEDA